MSTARFHARLFRVIDGDADEPGLFKDRVDAAHFGQRFNPWVRAQLARPADEIGANAGSAIGRMQDDAGERRQLRVERLDANSIPFAGASEEAVATCQRQRRRAEQADADGLVAMPQKSVKPGQGDLMAAVMPPSEVRPVATGRGADPEVGGEADRFFLRARGCENPGFSGGLQAAASDSVGAWFKEAGVL